MTPDYRGRGRRADFGAGAVLAGVYDAERDEFATITKIGTGLSDEGWREMHRRASALEVDHRPPRVNSILVPDVWLRPEIVVEVLADEITPSPRHTAGRTDDQPGLALRFPRILRVRTDKSPDQIDTLDRVREIWESQKWPEAAPADSG